MALFGKQNEKKEVKKSAKKPALKLGSTSIKNADPSVLIRPRITEKATIQAENNIYSFEVRSDATKNDVRKAVKAVYKVEPVKIRMTKNPSKKIFSRGKTGRAGGVKKAAVYLKKGQEIEVL
jgi:large subunit ribosomal protein L23